MALDESVEVRAVSDNDVTEWNRFGSKLHARFVTRSRRSNADSISLSRRQVVSHSDVIC